VENTFGTITFELSKEDMKATPQTPVLRMLDENELIGKFNVKIGEIIFNNDLLETWHDYVHGWQ
jgi:hypothetical protein